MIELTPEGATLFEQALQGKGGVVQVVYDLYFWAKLPELYARAWFEAEKFYSYEQTIDIDWSMYGDDEYVDKITEEFEDHETMGIELRFDAVLPDPEADRKLKERIRANMEQALQDAVLRKMIPDIETIPTDARGMPEDIEHLRREFETTKVATFETEYRENTAIEWNIAPQGTLPNITNLKDAEGNPVKWEDHATLVDLDDPFFKQLNVKVGVNADFDALPIHSIEVKLEYKHGDEHELAEYAFTDPDDVETFKTFIAEDKRDYTYSYQVNYVGSSRTYNSAAGDHRRQRADGQRRRHRPPRRRRRGRRHRLHEGQLGAGHRALQGHRRGDVRGAVRPVLGRIPTTRSATSCSSRGASRSTTRSSTS